MGCGHCRKGQHMWVLSIRSAMEIRRIVVGLGCIGGSRNYGRACFPSCVSDLGQAATPRYPAYQGYQSQEL